VVCGGLWCFLCEDHVKPISLIDFSRAIEMQAVQCSLPLLSKIVPAVIAISRRPVGATAVCIVHKTVLFGPCPNR
jgi:hypothetical protein